MNENVLFALHLISFTMEVMMRRRGTIKIKMIKKKNLRSSVIRQTRYERKELKISLHKSLGIGGEEMSHLFSFIYKQAGISTID